MKRFTLAVVGCALAFGAMAHRDNYFGYQFSQQTEGNQVYELGHKSWSLSGAVSSGTDAAGFPILEADGAYSTDKTAAGKCAIVFIHDQRSHGERVMPNLEEVRMSLISCTVDGPVAAHVRPSVTFEDENGESVTFNFDLLADDMENVQDVVSASVDGDPKSLGRINTVYVVFDDMEEGELLSPNTINFCSKWFMPTVNSKRKVTSTVYNRGPGKETLPPVITEEEGVTYIQAEDWDEPWINNRTTHSFTGGKQEWGRLYKEDQDVTTYKESSANGDGSAYARWDTNHGRIVGNRWADGGSGVILGNFCPGAESDMYYMYKGEYSDPVEGYVTVDNAMKNWGAWTEYTFDAEEDCLIDISLRVAAHRAVYEPQMQSEAYWWGEPDKGGYVLEGEYEPYTFMRAIGFKYLVSVDDVEQTTVYTTAPLLDKGASGVDFILACKDPAKWANTDYNGMKFNSRYLRVFPWAHWADDSDNQDAWGGGWYPYYKTDLVQSSFEKGHITEAALKAFPTADYKDIAIKAGRHTIKVQNCAGNSWFDEIRIKAHDGMGAGIENVSVDGFEDALGGTAHYFDLQGRPVANPANGIFIVKRGNKVTKEVIR